MTRDWYTGLGAIFAALAVGLGAFGAHALESHLAASGRTDTWETAVLYQLFHALALIVLGLSHQLAQRGTIAKLLVIGQLLFSGSLYLLCGLGVTWLGAITPFGGLAFLAAWVLWARNAWKCT